MNFTHGSLFSGIGGFDLAAEWMGWQNVFHCEKEPFCQKVLKYHFPNSILHNDITKTDFSVYRGTIDILTGGFPCQPFSLAGKRKGSDDERYLWPEMLRAIRQIQPPWVIGENVSGLVSWDNGMVFEQVQANLEIEGYEIIPFLLPAAGVKAPHERERIWFIAHACSKLSAIPIQQREQKERENTNLDRNVSSRIVTNAHGERCAKRIQGKGIGFRKQEKPYPGGESTRVYSKTDWSQFPTESPVFDRNDGFSNRLDGITLSKWRSESIKAGGNAIVPQVALQIFKAIEEYTALI